MSFTGIERDHLWVPCTAEKEKCATNDRRCKKEKKETLFVWDNLSFPEGRESLGLPRRNQTEDIWEICQQPSFILWTLARLDRGWLHVSGSERWVFHLLREESKSSERSGHFHWRKYHITRRWLQNRSTPRALECSFASQQRQCVGLSRRRVKVGMEITSETRFWQTMLYHSLRIRTMSWVCKKRLFSTTRPRVLKPSQHNSFCVPMESTFLITASRLDLLRTSTLQKIWERFSKIGSMMHYQNMVTTKDQRHLFFSKPSKLNWERWHVILTFLRLSWGRIQHVWTLSRKQTVWPQNIKRTLL